MARPKAQPKTKRLVWRMTDNSPLGEWVDPNAKPEPTAPKELPEVSSGGWIVSSFDLLNGIEMNDGANTVPDELFDELFAPESPKTKPSDPK